MKASRPNVAVVDLVMAAALTTAEVATVLPQVNEPLEMIGLIGALVVTASIALRSRAPMVMAFATSLGVATASVATTTLDSLWLLAAALIIGFSVGYEMRGRRRLVAIVPVLAGTFVLQSQVSSDAVTALATPLIIIGVPFAIGVVASRSRDQARRLQELTDALERERDRQIEATILAERTRIARELHDVIAHALSIMVVQAGAVEGELAPGSPLRAQVAAIRRTGRGALDESRRLLATIRAPGRDQGQDAARPLPGLIDMSQLIAQSSAQFECRGDPQPTSPGVELAAYRIVQESLTNVRRHAGSQTRASVTMEWSPERLVIRVEDNGASAGVPTRSAADTRGHGLIGMRERAATHGGTLTAGPRDDGGGWRVRAELPLTASPA